MARRRVVWKFTEAAIGAGVTRTLGQYVGAAGQNHYILEWEVYAKGVTASDPKSNVRLVRQGGAGTSSAVTGVMEDSDDAGTIQGSGRDQFSGAEPSVTNDLYPTALHVQGNYVWRGGGQRVVGAERIGLLILNNASGSITYGGHMIVEE